MTDAANGDEGCLFCRIIRGDVPCRKVYEDDEVFAFHDIRPQAPVHFMIIPRAHLATLYDGSSALEPAFGRMLALAGKLARQEGASDGFRTIINTGRVGCQEVYHVHMHVLGGTEPLGPMLSGR
jgi:histidine triad (HIT) family protein